jgi:hypothetical protein
MAMTWSARHVAGAGVAVGALLLLGAASMPAAAPVPETWRPLGGSLSADPEGWAFHPVIAAGADGTVYAAWTQHTRPAAWELSGIHVARWENGRWEALGGRIGHGRREEGAKWASAYAPALAVAGTTPYVAWYEGGGYGWGKTGTTSIRSSVFVAHWDGSRWVLDRDPGMPNGALNTEPQAAARTPRLAIVRGAVLAAWLETRAIPNSSKTYNVVVTKRLGREGWVPAGPPFQGSSGPTDARIVDLALADVAGGAYVAWSEFERKGGARPGQARVARLEEGRWLPVGTPLNTARDGYANYVAMSARGGVPYVAWQERPVAGSTQIYVKAWNGSAWVATGGSLNADSARGEAGRPAMIGAGGRLWLAWTEGDPGERARLHIRELVGDVWSGATGPLNTAAEDGAADTPGLATAAGRPYLIWAEKARPPATKQVYVREGR